MEYEIDTESDAMRTFGWTTPERYSSYPPSPKRRRSRSTGGEQRAFSIPESEELS